MRIACTADLHWGSRHSLGDQMTRQLALDLHQNPPDLFLLAGDIGTEDHFATCLSLFADLPCPKALVPGNHDVWVRADDPRGDSEKLFSQRLPHLSREHGFHYLDHGPLWLPGQDLAIVGTMNWYDYSWSQAALQALTPRWQWHLEKKVFRRGQHNDANFVRWADTDVSFTDRVVGNFEQHLAEALSQVSRVLVMTHHPPLQMLNPPGSTDPGLDELLWLAFSGNRALEVILQRHAEQLVLTLCGHTHFQREGIQAGVRGINIGSDYQTKQLLLFDLDRDHVTWQRYGMQSPPEHKGEE